MMTKLVNCYAFQAKYEENIKREQKIRIWWILLTIIILPFHNSLKMHIIQYATLCTCRTKTIKGINEIIFYYFNIKCCNYPLIHFPIFINVFRKTWHRYWAQDFIPGKIESLAVLHNHFFHRNKCYKNIDIFSIALYWESGFLIEKNVIGNKKLFVEVKTN